MIGEKRVGEESIDDKKKISRREALKDLLRSGGAALLGSAAVKPALFALREGRRYNAEQKQNDPQDIGNFIKDTPTVEHIIEQLQVTMSQGETALDLYMQDPNKDKVRETLILSCRSFREGNYKLMVLMKEALKKGESEQISNEARPVLISKLEGLRGKVEAFLNNADWELQRHGEDADITEQEDN